MPSGSSQAAARSLYFTLCQHDGRILSLVLFLHHLDVTLSDGKWEKKHLMWVFKVNLLSWDANISLAQLYQNSWMSEVKKIFYKRAFNTILHRQ